MKMLNKQVVLFTSVFFNKNLQLKLSKQYRHRTAYFCWQHWANPTNLQANSDNLPIQTNVFREAWGCYCKCSAEFLYTSNVNKLHWYCDAQRIWRLSPGWLISMDLVKKETWQISFSNQPLLGLFFFFFLIFCGA